MKKVIGLLLRCMVVGLGWRGLVYCDLWHHFGTTPLCCLYGAWRWMAADKTLRCDRYWHQRHYLHCILLCGSSGTGADCWLAGAGPIWALSCDTGNSAYLTGNRAVISWEVAARCFYLMLLKLIFHIGVNSRRCIAQGCQQITSHIPHRPLCFWKHSST